MLCGDMRQTAWGRFSLLLPQVGLCWHCHHPTCCLVRGGGQQHAKLQMVALFCLPTYFQTPHMVLLPCVFLYSCRALFSFLPLGEEILFMPAMPPAYWAGRQAGRPGHARLALLPHLPIPYHLLCICACCRQAGNMAILCLVTWQNLEQGFKQGPSLFSGRWRRNSACAPAHAFPIPHVLCQVMGHPMRQWRRPTEKQPPTPSPTFYNILCPQCQV